MTVTYADRSFIRLLFRWRGSIWKSVWKELVIFLALFSGINVCYRLAMTKAQQGRFVVMVHFIGEWLENIPVQFLLGFYVAYIVKRWWAQMLSIGWPDKFLLFVCANLPGMDRDTRLTRRTISRWANLHAVMVWKEISVKIKKRFPTNEHMVKAGLMTEKEFAVYNETSSMHGRWFTPISWIINLLSKCHKEGKITDVQLQKMVDELYAFRGANGMLTIYDWINAPLRYTQVTTLVTYGYFLLSLVGRQMVPRTLEVTTSRGETKRYIVDMIFPIVTILEFLFYIGWLKVAEEYRVPFGIDDDDFDMNYILDRDIYVSNMLVDELAAQSLELEPDVFWGNRHAILPHTKASYQVKDRIPNWRLYKYRIPLEVSELLPHTVVTKVNLEKIDEEKPLLKSLTTDDLPTSNNTPP